jgi:hypothetical protein
MALVRNNDGTYTDQATGQKYAANSIYFTNPSPEDPNPPQALLKRGAQPIASAPAPAPAPSCTGLNNKANVKRHLRRF